MPSIATAFAPASMGNVGIGFDILGLAYNQPGDEVEITLHDEPGLQITAIEGDEGQLSLDPDKNTASVAVRTLLEQVNFQKGMAIHIKKGMPLSSGLGGSAASSVAAVVAANALLEAPLLKEELLPACLEGEALASGGYHPDNIMPCLFGGINLMTGIKPEDRYPLPVPSSLFLALITPNVAVPTLKARQVIPKSVALKTYIKQSAYIALMIDALHRNDIEKMAYAMEQDVIIEPARSHLMPLLPQARRTAKRSGAGGLIISGAGPTLCAVCDDENVCGHVANALENLYKTNRMDTISYVTQVDTQGARLLSIL